MKSNILPLFEGDKRCAALLTALEETLYERGKGIPLPSVLGVIDLLKISMLENALG